MGLFIAICCYAYMLALEAELLRRGRSSRLSAQRLVQSHDICRRRVRSAVMLRSAQRRPAATCLPRRDTVSDRGDT